MQKLPIRAAILVGLAIVIGGAWVNGRAQQSASIDLPGPPDRAHWVPFSAQLERVTPNGTRFVGHFYRRSDGSTRHEAGYTWDRVERITINNVGQATSYQWDLNKGWVVHPMSLPPGGRRPGSPSALLLASMTRSADIEGFGMLSRDKGDYVEFLAPKLDMFPVRMQWKSCSNAPACGTWYTNIKVGEPPADLFELPAGEPVEQSSKPAGIYRLN